MAESIEFEFSRPLKIDDLSLKVPYVTALTADEAELKNLAERLEVLEVKALNAEVTVKRKASGHLLEVTGSLKASVVQECIVTLDPVSADIEASIESFYTDTPPKPLELDDYEAISDRDDPMYLSEGVLDVGETVAEHLALEIDLYPRAPGAKVPEIDGVSVESVEIAKPKSDTHRPFDVLKGLKTVSEDK